ncbi:hypothetical protein BCS42_07145 [Crenothrix sp. D3]|nr:hypothetical protein BCS42_07145 [Crenothrix sp. D3]
MSNFINPFDLLEIDVTDSEVIKKAKRRQLADIELNDGFLEIGNQKISRSEFIKIVDKLDDNKTKNMYFFIKKNTHLNELLLNNDVKFFYLYQPYKAYQNQDFINFISPYFAESFSQLLLKAFKTGSNAIVDKLFSVPLLVNQEHTDKLYKNLSRLLDEKIEEFKDIKNSVDEGIDDEDASDIIEAFEAIIDIDLLNLLPNYFQKQRNDIAIILWHIDDAIWKIIKDLQVSYNIIYYALRIEIDGTTKIRLNGALKQLNDISEKQKQAEKEQEVIQEWGDVLLEIRSVTEDIENGDIDVFNISVKINKLKIKKFLTIAKLNQLPESFYEINQLIALSLRNLSVVVWNETNSGDIAVDVIVLAGKIKTDTETSNTINKGYNDLQQAIKQHEEASNFNTNIRGDVVSINNDKVIYKNQSLVTKEIDKIKFGVDGSNHTIWYGDKSGNFIQIECNRLLNSTATVENQFRQILEASYNRIIPCILKNIENSFNNGKSIEIGNISVNKEGISYTTGSLFFKETHFVKWKDVSFSRYHGGLNVNKRNQGVVFGIFFRDTWNAVIFEFIKEHIIGIKG